ncbi:hypothetical protein ACQ4PT_041647 [Festuca glaucescens]
MPLRCCPIRSSIGFHGVRLGPADNFAVEITAGGHHCWLGMFDSSDEAAHAYDAAAWRFIRPHWDMNFPQIQSQADAEMLAPEPRLASQAERHRHDQAQQRLSVMERHERIMAEWMSSPRGIRRCCRPFLWTTSIGWTRSSQRRKTPTAC